MPTKAKVSIGSSVTKRKETLKSQNDDESADGYLEEQKRMELMERLREQELECALDKAEIDKLRELLDHRER